MVVEAISWEEEEGAMEIIYVFVLIVRTYAVGESR
jgi:hypothetical protein